VLTGSAARFMAAEQAAQARVAVDLVLEPEGRDTLAAVALAAALVARRDPEATVLVMPSDHLLPDAAAFAAAAERAAAAAAGGALVAFGLTPRAPSAAYGYIRPGAAAPDGGRRVAAFEEKPDPARAAALIAEGCLWNAGLFCFRAGAGLAEIRRLAPGAVAAAEQALDDATDDLGALRLRFRPWATGPLDETDRALAGGLARFVR